MRPSRPDDRPERPLTALDAGQDPAASPQPGPRSGRQQPADPSNAAAPPRPASPAAAAADLEARHAELSDAFLRAKAEAENTRRRAEEEMAKARKFAVESFAESLLPVKDSLEAAHRHPGRHAPSRCSKACTPRCAS